LPTAVGPEITCDVCGQPQPLEILSVRGAIKSLAKDRVSGGEALSEPLREAVQQLADEPADDRVRR
jgi:hypothetical protein